MAAFTDITHGFRPALNMSEIVDAVNERRLAAVASGATGLPVAIPSAPASVQSLQGGTVKPIHLLIQELLEALAPKYVDHGAAYPVATPYTLATWRTAAGLHASGFRRAAAWVVPPVVAPAFGHGLIQTGDIAGYWIWQDIVAGIKALKWTRKHPGFGINGENKQSLGVGASIAAAIADADSSWAAASWTTVGGSFYDRLGDVLLYEDSGSYYCAVDGGRSVLRVTLSSAAPVDCVCTFFMQVQGVGGGFFDFEGYADQSWNELDEQTIVSGATIATMGTNTMPAPTSTPASSSGVSSLNDYFGSYEKASYGLLKWTFSRV